MFSLVQENNFYTSTQYIVRFVFIFTEFSIYNLVKSLLLFENLEKLYYRGIWRYRKSKNFPIPVTFFHNSSFYLLLIIHSHRCFHRFYQIWMQNTTTVFILPSGSHLKSFKKFCVSPCMKFASSPRTKILKSILGLTKFIQTTNWLSS